MSKGVFWTGVSDAVGRGYSGGTAYSQPLRMRKPQQPEERRRRAVRRYIRARALGDNLDNACLPFPRATVRVWWINYGRQQTVRDFDNARSIEDNNGDDQP